jgi:hypothetical protein
MAHTTMYSQVRSVIGNCGHSRLNLCMEKKSNPGTPVNLHSGEIVSNECENSMIISENSQFYIGIRVVSVFMPFKQGHQFLNVEIMELINLVFSGIAIPFHLDRFTD